MKIIVGLNNNIIFEKLKDIYKDDVYMQDLIYKEGVIELLSSINDECIVITKENLDGNLNGMLYAKQIKLANKDTRVIYIVENLTNEYKEYLFANEIFDIIEGNVIDINEILECITRKSNVIYKVREIEDSLNEPAINMYNTSTQIIPKKIIAVYGTSGSGKSYVSDILGKNIQDDLNISTCVMDMDTENPNIDLLSGIGTDSSKLSEYIDNSDIIKLNNDTILNYMVKSKKFSKLHYLTSNVSLYESKNKLVRNCYENMYEISSKKFDYIVINLPNSIFNEIVPFTLNYADEVVFVINPNYVSIRQAIKYLQLITGIYNISKDKISIIINKVQNSSLDISQIKSILSEYEVVSSIKYNSNIESYINGSQTHIDYKVDFNRLYEKLGLKKSVNLKNNIFKHLVWKKVRLLNK